MLYMAVRNLCPKYKLSVLGIQVMLRGNELLGGSAISGKIVPPELYASDAKKLRNIIDKLYRDRTLKPFLVAPDMYYELNTPELPEFLNASGEGVIDATTRHIYNLGPGAIFLPNLQFLALGRYFLELDIFIFPYTSVLPIVSSEH
ncbi:hypothetical protein R1sor_004978 [Riccia sorocarpa]|uniref:Uncharacterized protein n=1 Tax=Riccia sorocarpa TaxID=122646 RepID=A0ABD3HL64_9MARC